jgi:ABC-type bacteriocin/lantibiotic exporter with double-glycine peptidase domain
MHLPELAPRIPFCWLLAGRTKFAIIGFLASLVLVVIHYSFMLDHYVAVLEVNDSEVIVGDPLNGLRHMSHAEFQQAWRGHGVVLRRGTTVPDR